MPRRDFSKVAFAATGDTNVIPTPTQPDGSISLQTGWGFDYQRDNGAGGGTPDPLAKNIDREDMNGILNEITASVGEIQQNGMPIWVPTAAPYPINARVRHLDKVWTSAVANNNSTPGSDANWADTSLISGRLLGIFTFDASGTLTLPAGARSMIADLQGGGGQGGGSPAGNATQLGYGTGGHSGARLLGLVDLTGLGGTIPVTIGVGGTTGVAGAAGQAGGTTSLSTYITCPGGAGGSPVGPTSGPTYIANSSAYPVPSSTAPVTVLSSQQGNGGYGGIAFSGGIAVSGIGGASPAFGGNVSGNIGTGTGSPGVQKGQGGSGAFSSINAAAQKGGNGAPGKATFWVYS